jgi:spiro-SPASM protein
LYFSGVAPLLDPDLCQEFWNRHVRYFSQYSYSENLPEGIIPKVLTREFLNSLPASLNVSSHDFFLKNINNYDVEIFFKKPDLRQYRLSLVPNSPRSYHLIHTILQKMENSSFSWKYENLQNFILANPESIRLSPAWIELEIYRGCELTCTFCPRQYIDNARDGNLLTKEDIRKIVQERNRLRGEVTYCLGGMGEPLLHPDLESVLRELLQTNELKEIIIETALYTDWSVQEQKIINLYKELSDLSRKKIQFIINFTTLSEKSYKNLYGENKLELVKENLKRLSEIIPKSQISVQILKIQETEEETEKYFNHFEKEGFPIVFQKYNRYITLMPEKRVSDLTPLIREFCWHLGRDLYIEADGTIKLCKQGILNVSPVLGNIRNEDLISIWERGLTYFEKTLKGEHQNIPMPCLQCDEWYTFNA